MKIKKLAIAAAAAVVITTAFAFAGCTGDTHTVSVYQLQCSSNGTNKTKSIIDIAVDDGDTFTKDIYIEEYYKIYEPEGNDSYDDAHFYTDMELRTKYTSDSVTEDVTLYYGLYSIYSYSKVCFVYEGTTYTIYRETGTNLTEEDFTKSAYGFGEVGDYLFYEDSDHTTPVDLSTVIISWNYFSDDRDKTFYVTDAA